MDTDGSRIAVGHRRPVRGRQPGPVESGCQGGGAPHTELVTVPARQALEAVDILRHGLGVGPVLHDCAGATLGFLVPPGTSVHWRHPGSACAPLCGPLSQEGTGRPPIAGADWLIGPESAALTATDPTRLRAALVQAARTLEVTDRCV